MTTIGVIGMGRMGQAIAQLLESRKELQLELFYRLSTNDEARLRTCDAVIEFTTATAAPVVIRQCLEWKVPVVSGTTGWHEYHLNSIISYAAERQAKFLYASNFSIGMNIVFALNVKLAAALKAYPDFKPSLKEIHHVHKKDSPSGTAYTLLNQIMEQQNAYTGFTLDDLHGATSAQIPVEAIREGEVKGYHEVNWKSPGERIMIAHEAFDRSIFAAGAIQAAEWLIPKPAGIYTMQDIIQL